MTTGFIALDIVSNGSRLWHTAGGTAANVAANMAFLGWRAAVAGTVGDDEAAVRLSNDLAACNVDIRCLDSREGIQTALVVHAISPSGHRFHFSCPVCGKRLPRFRPLPEKSVPAVLQAHPHPDVFFFDRASRGSIALAAAYKEAGKVIFFEPSRVGRADSFASAIELADVVKFSAQNEPTLESALAKWPDGQLRIQTLGPLGMRIGRNRRRVRALPAFPVAVADSAGAGDWATAGFLYALPHLDVRESSHEDLCTAAAYGQALAALSCRYPGARGLSEAMGRNAVRWRVTALMTGKQLTLPLPATSRVERHTRFCGGCLAAA
jgi:fructokinase